MGIQFRVLSFIVLQGFFEITYGELKVHNLCPITNRSNGIFYAHVKELIPISPQREERDKEQNSNSHNGF